MAEASAPMREALAQCAVSRPSIPVIANVTADVYPDDPGAIREALIAQLVSPVLWYDSVQRLANDGHRLFIESGPGKVLSGLMRDIFREGRMLVMQTADDLAKLRTLNA
jgi:[acyl-carrier-protein] S-malonyltransferase